MSQKVTNLDPKHYIIVKGAREHNLKNVDVAIPRNHLVVVTGVSGSGKSSLVIDTVYAEGQRRYVESLSSYARQFLMRMNKPDVDYIKGICPAIAVEQKVVTRSSRSTVGSLTEIYDYLKLLYARVGRTYSPISGEEVGKNDVSDVVDFIFKKKSGTKVQIFAPLTLDDHSLAKELELLMQKGFSRIWVKGEMFRIEDIDASSINEEEGILIVIDRLAVKKRDEDLINRCADSVQTAFYEGGGECIIDIVGDQHYSFSDRFELDGILFEEPTPHLFSFNSPYGACKKCEGFGSVIGIDESLVIPDRSLSIYEGAVACWKGEKMKLWKDALVNSAAKFDFPIHRPIKDLTKEEYDLLWTGNQHFRGINKFFAILEEKGYKIQNRVMLSRYRGKTLCPECLSSRLRKEVQYVKINDKSIVELLLMPVKDIIVFFKGLKLSKSENEIAKMILPEVNNRLQYLQEVGLGYLTLNRHSATLSGGETQRINLTRMLGSNLTNSMYLLDEPSIGLHPRDTQRLIKVLKDLRNLGNTVVVVEHEEEIIRTADYLIDMGPKAGIHGGEVSYAGLAKDISEKTPTLTAAYLTGQERIEIPAARRKVVNAIEIKGARQHNLQDVDVKIPLNALTVVTGVSGSGKTSLIKHILYPALKRKIEGVGNKPGDHDSLEGDLSSIKQVEQIDQNPLGKSSRSNPVTYIKAYDAIRGLFADQNLSKIRGYKPKHFSFNVPGGRCETCQGEGETVIEMQFLADVRLECEECNGQRFKPDVLEAKYKDKSIYDVLNMSVEEAIDFFAEAKEVKRKIQPLFDVGLGYVKLGQSSATLSGGEAQRVKLASYLGKGSAKNPIFFIFDEPSTGLHFNDVKILLKALNALIEKGHSVLVIEHDMDIVKCADWVIDLGPEGGEDGGQLLFQGTPEDLIKVKKSYTAQYLKLKL